MQIKKIALILIIFLLLPILSGCISENENKPITIDQRNKPPIPTISLYGIINQPPAYIDSTLIDAIAYAGDKVTFDATNSYDTDGDIISYRWIWGDDTTSEEAVVTREFYIDDLFSLRGLPLVFSITLEVEDNNYQPGFLQYTLGVIPKNYTFYFDYQKLTFGRPEGGKEMVKASLGILNQVQEVNYFLDEPIIIQRCLWSATIFLEKPWFTLLQKIIIILYDNSGQEIIKNEEDLGLNLLWTKKILQTNGSFQIKEEFKSIKLIVHGFSLWKNIGILYGGDNASQIYFDFTD